MSQKIEIKTDKDYLVFCNDMLEKYNIYKTQNEKLQQIIIKLKKTIAKLEKKRKKTHNFENIFKYLRRETFYF